jgi:predicted Fe-S protein YdhL (DUF1289 family)
VWQKAEPRRATLSERSIVGAAKGSGAVGGTLRLSMGPAHRRSRMRSAAKAGGYTPWYLLSADYRAAKRGAPQRTPNKKARRHRRDGDARPAPAPAPAPRRCGGAGLRLAVVAAVGVVFFALAPRAAALEHNPCNRICRYNKKLYDGAVCVGCFRTDDEIRAWASMDARQRRWAALDMAERRAAWEETAGPVPVGSPYDDGGFRDDAPPAVS